MRVRQIGHDFGRKGMRDEEIVSLLHRTAAIPRGDEPYRVVDLRTLIELKLTSGMSASDRLVDLADVIALVPANGLSREFADRLDPSVQEKFRELWLAAQTKNEY